MTGDRFINFMETVDQRFDGGKRAFIIIENLPVHKFTTVAHLPGNFSVK